LDGGPTRFTGQLPPGRCELWAAGEHGAFALQSVDLRAGETQHLALQLSRGATLDFEVRDERGSPCGLAKLEIERISSPGSTPGFVHHLERCDFEVDRRGRTNTAHLPAGRYRARAERGSQRSELVEFELEDGQERRVTLIVR
jgi:hypothetical protein